ncbi:GAF domain-containing protein [Conexibacter sp. W3-3-2]|uniref:ATP-binding protein n=1 Tax=Conexibacter sp. W3-3-2 TaxID=2675227 RepID=UPI0012B70032|nr:ATP-binding protein [Conexibacter sp. W3-3-2]MTD45321.1 GAF domain-containing protein [Conexibacter sp. W3-3-2]
MSLQPLPAGTPVDLTTCDREPIHVPGAIQPHGVLLVLDEPDLVIRHASANAAELLGVPVPQLLGTPLPQAAGVPDAAALARELTGLQDRGAGPIAVGWIGGDGDTRRLDAFAHRHDGLLLLELVPAGDRAGHDDRYAGVREVLRRLAGVTGVVELADRVAQEVRAMTGFDRVMVYRFAPDWSGHVIAEHRRADLESFLDLHYPASDIPVQARELYRTNWVRAILDIRYEPAVLEPPLRSDTGAPVDLSHAVLRSVSPMHLEYLANMDVRATLTISLMDGSRLWGLIACHHGDRKELPWPLRAAAEFLGEVVSLHLSTTQDSEEHAERARIRGVQRELVDRLSEPEAFPSALVGDERLLDVVGATGAIVQVGDERVLLGRTPPPERVDALLRHVRRSDDGSPLLVTATLPRDEPSFDDVRDVAAGVLGAPVSVDRRDWILWLRPEVVRTVSWGGDPTKPVEQSPDGMRLQPRRSFALWRETVDRSAQPWTAAELQAAEELRSTIVGVVVRRAEDLAALNLELERSNAELDQFAFIASHDLKEPLRGLTNYVHYLTEDHLADLDEAGRDQVATIMRLAGRMEDLIDTLLHYSRVGRIDLAVSDTDMGDVLAQTLAIHEGSLRGIEVRVPRPLPTVRCDAVRVRELLNNLVSNAIKYQDPDKDEHWIEVTHEPRTPPGAGVPEPAFVVRDNGIGIREKHLETIFRIFKRLHARDRFGGGTGAGLTLAEKIVQRHHGRIWAESVHGEGTEMCFTLKDPDA